MFTAITFVRHIGVVILLSFLAVCCCNPITPKTELDIVKEQLTENIWEYRCSATDHNPSPNCDPIRDPLLARFRNDGFKEEYKKSQPFSINQAKWTVNPVKVQISGKEVLYELILTPPPGSPYPPTSEIKQYIFTLTADSLILIPAQLPNYRFRTLYMRY